MLTTLDPDTIVNELDALSLKEGLTMSEYAAKLRDIADAVNERAELAEDEVGEDE